MTQAVEISTRGGVLLRGELQEGGPAWVVLVHDMGQDLDFWRPLRLSGDGLSVLAVDLRGHGGSEGNADVASTASDLVDVLAFARERGAEITVVGAAGGSVNAALEAAAETGAAGLAAICPLGEEVNGASMPKLVVVAEDERRQVAAGRALQCSPGSAIVVNLPVSGGSAEVVSGAWRTNVESYVRAFVRDVTRPSRPVAP
jgi:pimeloyl-ACP methyl ester carboxylesterase